MAVYAGLEGFEALSGMSFRQNVREIVAARAAIGTAILLGLLNSYRCKQGMGNDGDGKPCEREQRLLHRFHSVPIDVDSRGAILSFFVNAHGRARRRAGPR